MIISTRNRRRTVAVLAVLALAGAAPPDAAWAPDELSLRRKIVLPADLGTGPVRLAIDPRRHRLFMVTSAAAAVDVIDEDTGSVRARIPVPAEAVPVYRGSDDRLMVLSPGRAATYDGTTYARIATAPFTPAVTAATYDASLGRLYVIGTHDGETRLSAIDAVSLAEGSTIAVGMRPSARAPQRSEYLRGFGALVFDGKPRRCGVLSPTVSIFATTFTLNRLLTLNTRIRLFSVRQPQNGVVSHLVRISHLRARSLIISHSASGRAATPVGASRDATPQMRSATSPQRRGI